MGKLSFVNYSDEMFSIIKSARFRVPDTPEQIDKYKYPHSNEYKKDLHQIVFDYYFKKQMVPGSTDRQLFAYIIRYLSICRVWYINV